MKSKLKKIFILLISRSNTVFSILGSEEDCTEQIQILSAVADADNLEISGTCDIFYVPELQSNEPVTNGRVSNYNGKYEIYEI